MDPVDFARKLMYWADEGLPELGDECSPGVCSQIKAVVNHPQFSEEPLRVSDSCIICNQKNTCCHSLLDRKPLLTLSIEKLHLLFT